jgi:hypothetical protein
VRTGARLILSSGSPCQRECWAGKGLGVESEAGGSKVASQGVTGVSARIRSVEFVFHAPEGDLGVTGQ